MFKKFSALALALLLGLGAFSCEAARMSKEQLEEIYNAGGTVSTKPRVVPNKPKLSTQPAIKQTEVKAQPAIKQPTAKVQPINTQPVAQPIKVQTTKVESTTKSQIAKVKPAEQTKKVKSVKVKKKESKSSKAGEQKQNSSSWRIKTAQKNLRILGYSKEASTGKLTSTTKEALIAFQKKYKLKAKGELDNETYAKLNWEAFAKTGIKNIKGSEVVAKAAKYKGVPYVFGGTTPKGFDCSGYTQYVFKQLGAQLTRTADTQAEECIFITKAQLKPGDLVFFSTYERGASHVGIYAGGGQFWNASSSRGVILYKLSDDYWRTRYYGARRVLVSNGEIK
mgnify:CR=1 FL=1